MENLGQYWGCRGGSVSEVSTTQAQGSEFRSLAPTQKPDMAACICDPRVWGEKTGGMVSGVYRTDSLVNQ